jgi:hypothetical protein
MAGRAIYFLGIAHRHPEKHTTCRCHPCPAGAPPDMQHKGRSLSPRVPQVHPCLIRAKLDALRMLLLYGIISDEKLG